MCNMTNQKKSERLNGSRLGLVVGCGVSARESLRGEVCVAWRGSQVGGKPGIYSDVEISTCAPKMKLSQYGKIHDSHSLEAWIQLFRRRV